MSTVSPISHLDHTQTKHATGLDWPRIAYLTQLSRAIDHLEETELLKNREVLYQFSARGHDMAQIILASLLDHPGDAASGYYRSRPFLLALDLDLEDAMAGPMMRAGGLSDGRDIGVVFNLPQKNNKPCFLPMSGGVGAQYTHNFRLGGINRLQDQRAKRQRQGRCYWRGTWWRCLHFYLRLLGGSQ